MCLYGLNINVLESALILFYLRMFTIEFFFIVKLLFYKNPLIQDQMVNGKQ